MEKRYEIETPVYVDVSKRQISFSFPACQHISFYGSPAQTSTYDIVRENPYSGLANEPISLEDARKMVEMYQRLTSEAEKDGSSRANEFLNAAEGLQRIIEGFLKDLMDLEEQK